MEKISINLLPIEFTQQQVKKAKFYKIQALGVSIILFMVFLASLTVALRILQSHNIQKVEAQVSQQEERITTFKDRQASLLILKNRLTAISQYLGVSSPQAGIYKLVNELLPPSVSISSISVNRNGEVLVSALVPDPLTLDEAVSNLTSKDKNQNKISQVSIDSLTRGKDGIYRIGFKVKPKR